MCGKAALEHVGHPATLPLYRGVAGQSDIHTRATTAPHLSCCLANGSFKLNACHLQCYIDNLLRQHFSAPESEQATCSSPGLAQQPSLTGLAGQVGSLSGVGKLVEGGPADVESHPANHGEKERGNDAKTIVTCMQCKAIPQTKLVDGHRSALARTSALAQSKPGEGNHLRRAA